MIETMKGVANPAVSVIMIFHNEVRFLAEAVASVRAQSFCDFELILVDDGSTDGSTSLAERLCNEDRQRSRLLHHLHKQRKGMAASRNLGLSQARGIYVAFLDADDVWMPGKLAEQVAVMESNPTVAIVYGRTLIWNSWDPGAGASDFLYDLGLEPDRVVRPPEALHVMLANRSQTPTTCNALMRRKVLQQLGGSEISFSGMFEDQVLFSKLLISQTAYISSRIWAKYRQHPDSHSARASAFSIALARRRFLLWLERYARAVGLYSAKLGKSLREERRGAYVQIARALTRTPAG